MNTIPVELHIIGTIQSPYKDTADAPPQGTDTLATITIDADVTEGLTDIEGFSHLHIFYWLHQSKGYDTMVHTPWDRTPHGLFTTRTPHRPNPIGYAVVELVKREKNILHVKGLDALDGTPVLDIKPYVPSRDARPDAHPGWLRHTKL